MTTHGELTCNFCRSAPATHLLVADLNVVGRTMSLTCETCGIQGVRDAQIMSVGGASTWLYELRGVEPFVPQGSRQLGISSGY